MPARVAALLPPKPVDAAKSQDPTQGCPFSSQNPQAKTLRDQLSNLANQISLGDTKANPHCTQLAQTFQSNSAAFQALSQAMDTDPETGDRIVRERQVADARVNASRALTNVLNAGCSMKDSRGLLDAGLYLMDAVASGVMVTGFANPANFVVGAGMSAASQLGLAISRWFRNRPKKEIQAIQQQMKGAAFRDQLCLFRNLYYRLDQLDPHGRTDRKQKIVEELAQKNAQIAEMDACVVDADASTSSAVSWFATIKNELEGATKPDVPLAQQCQRMQALFRSQEAKVREAAHAAGCDETAGASGSQSAPQKDFCFNWKQVEPGLRAISEGGIDCNSSPKRKRGGNPDIEEFVNRASSVMRQASGVLVEKATAALKEPSGAMPLGDYQKLKAAKAALEAELKILNDPNQALSNDEWLESSVMVSELGKLMMDGLGHYADGHHEQAESNYTAAIKALPSRRGILNSRPKNPCQSAQLAASHAERIQPSNGSLGQICEALGGNGPLPPKWQFKNPSRNFHTLTGEESFKKGMSPLQRTCSRKPAVSPAKIEALNQRIRGEWQKSCTDQPLPIFLR